jgi:hypothetical protein
MKCCGGIEVDGKSLGPRRKVSRLCMTTKGTKGFVVVGFVQGIRPGDAGEGGERRRRGEAAHRLHGLAVLVPRVRREARRRRFRPHGEDRVEDVVSLLAGLPHVKRHAVFPTIVWSVYILG